MNLDYQIGLVKELISYPKETEWIEFKLNNDDPQEIGEYISALSNSAALDGKVNAYMVWGIENDTHNILGTTFKPSLKKIGNEELESWLLKLLKPKINFKFYEFHIDNHPIVLLEIGAAFRHPVQFQNTEYIRIGSYKKKLKDFPEKERELWRVFDKIPFEKHIAIENLTTDNVLNLLDYTKYFDSLKIPLPFSKIGILQALEADLMIIKNDRGNYNITNLGAMLFAKQISDFPSLKRKVIRVIVYKDKNKIETQREQTGSKGYVSGFEGLMEFIKQLLPSNEVIKGALRSDVPMFPELAVRELVVNAIIHQDFFVEGAGPMIEIFSNRMEITNPGAPLVSTDRFLDSPPRSRNEVLASFMRRVGICEERGSGIDKVVFETEFYQLPAPVFEVKGDNTISILFAHKNFWDMDNEEKIRACYLHSCLKFVQREFMTNTTLRERFGIDEKNSAAISRIIKDTYQRKLIDKYDENAGRKYVKYIPWWAR